MRNPSLLLLASTLLVSAHCFVGAIPASADESLLPDRATERSDGCEANDCLPCPDCCRDACYCDSGNTWTVTADAMFLHRDRARWLRGFVRRGDRKPILSASDLGFGTQAGPRIGLQRQLASGRILDIGYFGVEGWNSRANFGPGDYILTGDKSQSGPEVLSASFDYASSLHTAEINVRSQPGGWLQPLAGFRWVRLDETYQVTGVAPFGFPALLMRSLTIPSMIYMAGKSAALLGFGTAVARSLLTVLANQACSSTTCRITAISAVVLRGATSSSMAGADPIRRLFLVSWA